MIYSYTGVGVDRRSPVDQVDALLIARKLTFLSTKNFLLGMMKGFSRNEKQLWRNNAFNLKSDYFVWAKFQI